MHPASPVLRARRKGFFEAMAAADETAGERGGIGSCPGRRQKFGGELRHCDVGFFFDAGDEERFMRIALGVAPSAARSWGKRSGRPESLHQPDDERNRHAEMRGNRMTRPASRDKVGNPFPKIANRLLASRIASLRKGITSAALINSPRVNLRIRRSSF
jgi:hypothetical protein